MADEKSGIEQLRKLSRDMYATPLWMCLRAEREPDWGGRSNAIRLPDALDGMIDQIEIEHAAELAAAKRDMTDEAREVVERLLAVDADGIYGSESMGNAMCRAVNGRDDGEETWRESFGKLRDRLIELIEHGGKPDVDVAALWELADKVDGCAGCFYEIGDVYDTGDGLSHAASKYFGIDESYHSDDAEAMFAEIAKRIRKAVEGAPQPDAEREAAADWVEAQGGLDEVQHHYAFMVDQVAQRVGVERGEDEPEHVTIGKIVDELDKRLMPHGMEWPRFEDGAKVKKGDKFHAHNRLEETIVEVDAVLIGMAGNCVLQGCGGANYYSTDGRVKRPEPEVLGADGLPIKVGETVYLLSGDEEPRTIVEIKNGMVYTGDFKPDGSIWHPIGAYSGDNFSHTQPDTQQRIDEDMGKESKEYWNCEEAFCDDCPSRIAGEAPYEHYGVYSCAVAQGMDIARREHELRAKTMGGDAS